MYNFKGHILATGSQRTFFPDPREEAVHQLQEIHGWAEEEEEDFAWGSPILP